MDHRDGHGLKLEKVDINVLCLQKSPKKRSGWYNLVPRFSLLPVERPWLGLVTCLPESGRLQTNDLGEGRIRVRFVSTKRRRRDQWKPCLKGPVFYSSRTSQDKTSNAESFDS